MLNCHFGIICKNETVNLFRSVIQETFSCGDLSSFGGGRGEKKKPASFTFQGRLKRSKMSRTEVTITLGRSGQKVVKRPWPISDTFLDDASSLSGSKRSLANRDAQDSLFSAKKRMRGDAIPWSTRYDVSGGAKISGNDLRLKLLRKRMDKKVNLEQQKRIEQWEKMPRTIQSSEWPEGSLPRNIPPSRRAGESQQMESLRSSYSSPYMDRLRPKSQDSIPRISGGMSSSRSIEVLRLPPSRPIDAPRIGYMMHGNLLDPSYPKASSSMSVMTSSTRTSLDMCKSIKEFPSASSTLPRSTYPEEPLTVSSLLHSLGLGKYAIHFQAEEIDMAALKQMGERDLKELGIPMGPRKKILLALLSRSKRPAS